MAVIEKIRRRFGFVALIFIGLSLLLFVVADLFDTNNSFLTKQKNDVAEINGKKIDIKWLYQKINDITEITKMQYKDISLTEEMYSQIRENAWNEMLEEFILNAELDKLGLTVSSEELFDLIQGNDPHPVIRQFYTDPATGQFYKTNLLADLRRIQEEEGTEQKMFWIYLEKFIHNQRKTTKYNNLFSHGIYANSLEAEKSFYNSRKLVDLNYISLNFRSVPDSAIEVKDKDLKKYYEKNKLKYQQEKNRDLKYVVFEVFPSEQDAMDAEKWINEQMDELMEATSTQQFINYYSDTQYDTRNYKKGELPGIYDDFMFSAQIGDVYGPYFENESYKIAKLSKITYLPDSVKLRQIFLGGVDQNNYMQVKYFADSLKTQIEKGADFALMARVNSMDETKNTGGDIGWLTEDDMKNQFSETFSDSCINAKPDEVYVLPSQSGVHIVQVEKRSPPVKKVQVGVLEKRITASEETLQNYYIKADLFAGNNNTYEKIINATKNNDPNLRNAFNVKPLDSKLPGIDNAREIIKWAYQTGEKEVSPIFTLDNKFVLVTIDKVNEKGYIPFDDIKDEIEMEVIKHLKAEKIKTRIVNASQKVNSIEELANELNTEVQNAQAIRYNSYTFGNSGPEPKVVAAAVNIKQNTISKPLVGENGVYVLFVTNSNETEIGELNIPLYKSFLIRNYSEMANTKPYETLIDLANVKDFREYFY